MDSATISAFGTQQACILSYPNGEKAAAQLLSRSMSRRHHRVVHLPPSKPFQVQVPQQTGGSVRKTRGHLLDLVVARGEGATHSVADLMVGHQGLALAICHGCPLHASYNAVYTVIDLAQCDGIFSTPSCEDGSLQAQSQSQHSENAPCVA